MVGLTQQQQLTACDAHVLLITMQFTTLKNQDNIRCERIISASENNDTRNFCTEVKKVCASRSVRCRTVDGLSNENDIAQLFASSYKDLYTSVAQRERQRERERDFYSHKAGNQKGHAHQTWCLFLATYQ